MPARNCETHSSCPTAVLYMEFCSLSSGSAAMGGFLFPEIVDDLHFFKLYAFKILLKYCAEKERLIVPLSINSIVMPKNSSDVDLVKNCCVATLSPMTSRSSTWAMRQIDD
eukprot:4672031-Amphidinium_carterae.1